MDKASGSGADRVGAGRADSGTSSTVDVIIPARNRAHLLPATLDSVLAQTVPPQTIWVVDDGSSDGTPALLETYTSRYANIAVVRTEGVGVSAARNIALRQSSAALVAFIDSDDVWDPRFVEALSDKFAHAEDDLGLVNCGLMQIDEHGLEIPGAKRVIPSRKGKILHAILDEFYGQAPSTMMVRRDMALAIGGFDEALFQGEDRDFCMRLAETCVADFVPDVLTGLRQHGQNTYESAMRTEPDVVLFQRLAIWNKFASRSNDPGGLRLAFRNEAARAASILRQRSDPDELALYRRLEESAIPLARSLFADPGDYLACVRDWSSRNAARSSRPRGLKAAIAERVFARSRHLLSLAHRFGRLTQYTHTPRKR